MDFFHNSTILLSLFMSKKDVIHLINQNLNLHVLNLIFYKKKMIFWLNTVF